MKRAVKGILIAVCVIAILIGAWNIFRIQYGYHRGQSSYDQISTLLISDEDTTKNEDYSDWEPEETPEYTGETAPPVSDFPEMDFAALREINPDVVGWLYSPDTPINYPIVQGKDNDYYLHRLFTGEENTAGCLFMDCGNSGDFTDYNNIVYGHNMNDGSMLASLLRYMETDYYSEHPTMMLMTPEKNYKVEVFSGYILSGWGDAWRLNFKNEQEYNKWVNDAWKATRFPTEYVPTPGEKILTLSTCTYEFEDARFVVLGVLHEE